MNAAQLEEAAVYAEEHATEVARSSPDHGPRHWRDVARISFEISDMEANPLVFLFACIHDTQRENEYYDPMHGERAADALTAMCNLGIVDITSGQMNDLRHTLIYHDKGGNASTQNSPIDAICWDADRLTLPRVGIIPDKQYMSMPKVIADLGIAVGVAMTVMESPDVTWGEIARAYA